MKGTLEALILTYRILKKRPTVSFVSFLVSKLTSPPNPSLKLQTASLTIWNILYSYFFFICHTNSSVRFLWAAFKTKYVRMGECVLYCTVTQRSNTHVLFGMWPIFFFCYREKCCTSKTLSYSFNTSLGHNKACSITIGIFPPTSW